MGYRGKVRLSRFTKLASIQFKQNSIFISYTVNVRVLRFATGLKRVSYMLPDSNEVKRHIIKML